MAVKITCKSDVPINRIPNLKVEDMTQLLDGLQSSKRTRAVRSLTREVRLWFKRQATVKARGASAGQYSQQDGCFA